MTNPSQLESNASDRHQTEAQQMLSDADQAVVDHLQQLTFATIRRSIGLSVISGCLFIALIVMLIPAWAESRDLALMFPICTGFIGILGAIYFLMRSSLMWFKASRLKRQTNKMYRN